MEKKCNICNSIKNMEDFYKNQNRCKLCTKEYALENKEKIKSRKKIYRENNKEFIAESNKKYYQSNLDKIKDTHINYYKNNLNKIKKIQKEYREENKEVLRIKGRESSKMYHNKNKNNPLYIIKKVCRGQLRAALNKQNYIKTQRTEEILGISFEDFKLYIESKFEDWMSWENHGKFNSELNYGWDIDHIIPLDSADTEEELLKLNHYTNLQPLCSYTNRHIKMYKKNY